MALASALALAAENSSKTRCRCWREAVPAALDAGPAAAAEAAEVAAAVVATLELYSDSPSSLALEAAVGALARRADLGAEFARTLAARVVALSTGPRPMTPLGQLSALRVLCCALRANFEAAAGAGRDFDELVLAQGRMLHSVLGATRRPALGRAALAALHTLFGAVSEAAARYAAVLLALATPTAESCALAAALLGRRRRAGEALAEDARRAGWLAHYAAAAFGSSAVRGAANGFAPLLGTATQSEWADALLPAALKGLRRTPDAALAPLAALIDSLSAAVCTDAAVPQLVEALTASVAAAAAERAAAAVAVLRALGRRSGTAAAAATASGLVAGCKSAMTGTQQRVSVCSALAALGGAATAASGAAEAAEAAGITKAAECIVSLLLPLLAKEASEAGRGAIVEAVGVWLPFAASEKQGLPAFQKGLADKNAEARRGFLGGVLAALAALNGRAGGETGAAPAPSATLLALLTGLAEPLVAMLRPALKKAPSGGGRADAVGVLCCLAEASAICPALASTCATEKVWSLTLKSKDSFLWALEPMAAASERELALLHRLFRTLAGGASGPAASPHAATLFAAVGEGGGLMFRTLLLLSALPAAAARRPALETLRALAAPAAGSDHAERSEKLLGALEAVTRRLDGASGSATSSEPEPEAAAASADGSLDPASAGRRAGWLACGAYTAMGGWRERPSLLPRLLLVSHHPVLRAQSVDLWARFCAGFAQPEGAARLVREQAEPIAALLGGERGALSEARSARAAALGGLRAAMQLADEAVLPALLPSVQPLLASTQEELAAATPSDVRVMATPVGRLSTDPAPGGGEAGGGGGGGGDDWEAEVKTSLKKKADAAAKAKAGGKASKQELMRQQQEAAEAATRARLTRACTAMSHLAELIGVTCCAAPVASQLYLPQLLPLLLPLPSLAILEGSGGQPAAWMMPLFDGLAGCGGALLRPFRPMLSQAMVQALRAPEAPLHSETSLCAQLGILCGELRDELRAPLSCAGASLVLPLLRRALSAEASGEAARSVQEAAFELLCLHAAPSPALTQPERVVQVQLLLGVMGRGERWHPQAAAALHSLAPTLGDGSLADLQHGALYGGSPPVRLAAASALGQVGALTQPTSEPLTLAVRLWLLRFDEDSGVSGAADAAWTAWAAAHPAGGEAQALAQAESSLIRLLGDEEPRVRKQVAAALAGAAARDPGRLHALLQQIFEVYKTHAAPPAAAASRERAAFGEEPQEDPAAWRHRQGVALALAALAPSLKAREQLPVVFSFLKKGLADEHEAVAQAMVAAGREVIDKQAAPDEMVGMLVPMLEAFLAEPATTETHDRVRQGVVLYFGALAKHIPADDPKVAQVVERLMDALGTPSEVVQRTISLSLKELASKPAVKARAAELLEGLLKTNLASPSYASRRGAAFGLAGVVKGLGIPSLKQHGVMVKLQEAVEDKGKGEAVANAREGALQAFECLCEALGRLFEPYIITILPLLLACVADGSGAVRHAAVAASQRIMSQLSAQGVKMVLPALLKALDEDKWRTTHAAVELLGSMAYCAPKQLSNALPQVVPALTGVLTHSHPKVKEGANAALASVGAVIKNPEIAELVPTLLEALSEPSTKTGAALDALAHCQFEHCVDPPSLALIVPVLHRGLRERTAQAKRKTSHITGNMCSLLADRKDVVPYLPLLLPELQSVLHDPIPEVRSTGAKALGRLTAGLGEEHFSELLPWLLASLSKEGSAVERAGAAQGLAEVLFALGDAKVDELLPTLIAGCRVGTPASREGHAMLWVHLPAVLGHRFEPFLDDTIPVVLDGLADEDVTVRETAMKGAQAIIRTYLYSAARLLLPPLQAGLSCDNYKVRTSSAELLGDLMSRLTQQEFMVVLEEGEEMDEHSPLASIDVPQQHSLLAAIYIARNDLVAPVRVSAAHVWKSLISNGPKTLRIILPSLTEQLLSGLSDDDEDRQAVAARTLGELVSKLAERVVPKIVPILQHGLQVGEPARRRGVCLGLSEMMGAAGKELVTEFLSAIIPAVRTALCDAETAVRLEIAGYL